MEKLSGFVLEVSYTECDKTYNTFRRRVKKKNKKQLHLMCQTKVKLIKSS